jgi:serine beta-lactamase-like protein LACTB
MNFNILPAGAAAYMIAASLTSAAAPTFSSTALTNAISQSRSLIQNEMAGKVPGMSVAVAVNGAIVWSEAFGFADLEAKKPATTATRFRIGSVSKPLTSAGLALLVEQGKIDLDAPIQKYIPDFPPKDGVITTRLLAGHLSGIRNYKGSKAASRQEYPHLRDGLKIFENDPLIAPPGTKFSYASYNWNTIGVIMEVASKQKFLSYMDDHVIRPLELSNTVPDLVNASDPQRAQFYEIGGDGKFMIAPAVNLSFVWPAGGYLSTTEDLVRFGSALLQPGFLKSESLRLLFTSQTTSDGKPTHYGIGWFVVKNIVFHEGDSIGGSTILLMVPAARMVVAIACNRGHLALGTVGGRPRFLPVTGAQAFDRKAIAASILKNFAPLSGKSDQAK